MTDASKLTIGYHDIDTGMIFREVTPKKPRAARVVRVTDTAMYSVLVTWLSPRGLKREITVPRKQLSDPAKWVRVVTQEAP